MKRLQRRSRRLRLRPRGKEKKNALYFYRTRRSTHISLESQASLFHVRRRYDIRVYRQDPHVKRPLYGNALVRVNYSCFNCRGKKKKRKKD